MQHACGHKFCIRHFWKIAASTEIPSDLDDFFWSFQHGYPEIVTFPTFFLPLLEATERMESLKTSSFMAGWSAGFECSLFVEVYYVNH